MKHILSLTTALAVLALLTSLASDTAFAQTNGKQFGKTAMQQYGPFDDDGDGIPNGQDPDYVKPKNGTGHQFGKSNGGSKMNGVGKGNGYGPGNGSGNHGIGPRNGGGYGSGNGTCNGTGPNGRGRRGN